MGDAKHPAAQGAFAIEHSEAAPEGKMDVLQQVAPLGGIRLVTAGQALQGWAESVEGAGEFVVLACA
jgi:hypothetical protein